MARPVARSHRAALDVFVKIDSALVTDRVAGKPAAQRRQITPIPHIIILRFGIGVVSATARENFVFSKCDHLSASKLQSITGNIRRGGSGCKRNLATSPKAASLLVI